MTTHRSKLRLTVSLDMRQSKRQVLKIETPTAHRNNGLTRFTLATIFLCVKGDQSHFIYSPFDTPVTASGGVIFFHHAR